MLTRSTPPVDATGAPLHRRLDTALDSSDPSAIDDLAAATALDERDETLVLLMLHDLWLAPTDRLGTRVRWQRHPAVLELQLRLERSYLERLRRAARPLRRNLPDGVAGMRRVAALDRVPVVYDWLRDDAGWDELVEFLTVEGGPDAGFDDLVAIAQVGLSGDVKLALAENYWDEMGRGQLSDVHTELHHRLVSAVSMRAIPRADLPTGALTRMALNGVVATNRSLQPELLGALGLLELQAGPRCRAVLLALERLDAPAGAAPFYREHAEADPRHGKEWVDRVVAPLSDDPDWARRMVDGALWRHLANDAFFASRAPATRRTAQ